MLNDERTGTPPWDAGSGAIVPHGTARAPSDDDYDSSSESEMDEANLPAGPIDPAKCTVGGKGFAGGAAQSLVTFFITAKDCFGKVIKEGGAYVVAKVIPTARAAANGGKQVVAEVKDNSDGTYTVKYSVAARGDYEVISRTFAFFSSLLLLSPACICFPSLALFEKLI